MKLCTGGEVKFAVIRNPFDVVASWFCLNSFNTITEMLDKYEHTWFRNKADGKLFTFFEPYVDRYLRYEDLDTEIDELMDELGLRSAELRKVNVTQGKKHYSHYYTPEEVERMYIEFPEITQYNYQFESEA
jgi:hypothetical protein